MKDMNEVNKDKVNKLYRLVIKTKVGDDVLSGWYYFKSLDRLMDMKDKIIAKFDNIVEVNIQW